MLDPGPPAGSNLLDQLRAAGTTRPALDPDRLARLRQRLEAAAAESASELAGDATVFVTKSAINQVLLCEGHLAASRAAPERLSEPLVHGTLIDHLFRHLVTTGELGDAMGTAREVLEAEGDTRTLELLDELGPDTFNRLSERVARDAGALAERWPALPARFHPRTQERIVVALAGGRVVLSGRLDLALGVPDGLRSTVCLLDVKAGHHRAEHRTDMHFYALLEALRSGAPPFQVATYYVGEGRLDREAVSEAVLQSATRRCCDAVVRLCRLAAGHAPVLTPNPLCRFCAALPSCAPGQERAAARAAGDEEVEVDDEA